MMNARRRTHVRFVVPALAGVFGVATAGDAPPSRIDAPPEWAFSAHSEVLSRQFDFWLGEWDVTRIRPNPDGTAEELGTERVLVYPVLDGTGVAAFRQSSTSKGLSLFHADPGKHR